MRRWQTSLGISNAASISYLNSVRTLKKYKHKKSRLTMLTVKLALKKPNLKFSRRKTH